jgi:hypothetical protein
VENPESPCWIVFMPRLLFRRSHPRPEPRLQPIQTCQFSSLVVSIFSRAQMIKTLFRPSPILSTLRTGT